jgi:hypothetical protein
MPLCSLLALHIVHMIFTKITLAVQYLTLLTLLNLSSHLKKVSLYCGLLSFLLGPLNFGHFTQMVTLAGSIVFECLSLCFFPVAPTLFHVSFLILRQSVGLFGQVISPSQGHYLHKHRINAAKHPCLCPEWDSNPQSQRLSEQRQFMP